MGFDDCLFEDKINFSYGVVFRKDAVRKRAIDKKMKYRSNDGGGNSQIVWGY